MIGNILGELRLNNDSGCYCPCSQQFADILRLLVNRTTNRLAQHFINKLIFTHVCLIFLSM